MLAIPYIPYFLTSRYRVATMIELAGVRPNDRAVDLGSGDGRIVMALARAGAQAHGYELDTTLVNKAKKLIKEQKLQDKAFVHNKDFWEEDLSSYTIVCVYPMPDVMQQLETKLQNELKPGSRILLNYYPFDNWPARTQRDKVYLYSR